MKLQLEKKLQDAENELIQSNLDARLQQLENLDNQQKLYFKNYDDQVQKLNADVANIAKIRESLPDGCFRRMHLEP